jgi:hypothetical protein
MSTEYIIHQGDGEYLSLDEHSNLFDLSYTGPIEVACIMRDLTPNEVVHMALRMLATVSYWMDSDELEASVKDYIKSTLSYNASLLRDLGRVAGG